MPRARNIKPGFFKNEDLAECSPWARLCFAGLWTLADREGRLEDRPKRIKAELFAFDAIEVEPLLAELDARGFLVRYRNEDGSFIQISKFTTHQTPHYSEKKSVIKPPELQESAPDEADKKPGVAPEDSKSQVVIKRGSQPPDSLNPDSLNPDSLNPEEDSDADASGGQPPPDKAEPTKPLSPKDRVWLLGPALMGEKSRGLLGKLAGAYGDELLAEVLAEATVEKPIEPKAWVTASCEAKAKARPTATKPQTQADLLADPTPDWALQAGFPSRFEAENEGCTPFNAKRFRNGKRLAA